MLIRTLECKHMNISRKAQKKYQSEYMHQKHITHYQKESKTLGQSIEFATFAYTLLFLKKQETL